jgi:3-oxoacyl-[acyl-carrier-protein] synthase III
MRAELRSLAIGLPRAVRTNDFFRREHPEVVAANEEKAAGALSKVWAVRPDAPPGIFEQEMLRYVSDPFRGTVERPVLAEGDSAMTMSVPAAKAALTAANAGDVDLVISCSFPSEQTGIGEAAFLAKALGHSGAAWNVESACSSALVGLDVAASLVESGRHRRVLVVTSCIYSRVTDPSDTLSWTSGDAAAAFVVARGEGDAGLLATHNVQTSETCGAIGYDLVAQEHGSPVMRMRTRAGARDALRNVAERTVDECCHTAAEKAGVHLDEIALFVPNTPTAWFAAFFARKLGVPVERVVDTHPRFANVGPALWPTALHTAALAGRARAGDLVMLYAIGSVASSTAAVMRWGDVALGRPPEPARLRL